MVRNPFKSPPPTKWQRARSNSGRIAAALAAIVAVLLLRKRAVRKDTTAPADET